MKWCANYVLYTTDRSWAKITRVWSMLSTKSYYSCLSALVPQFDFIRIVAIHKQCHEKIALAWKYDRYRPIFMEKTPSLFRDKKPLFSSKRRKGWKNGKLTTAKEHWGAQKQEVLLCAFVYWLNCENLRQKSKELLLHHRWNNAKNFGPHHLFLLDAANGYYRPR